MNLSLFTAVSLSAAALLASTLSAQGESGAPNGSLKVRLVPGAHRGPPEAANTIFNNGPFVNSTGTGVGGVDESVLQNVSRGHNWLGLTANDAGVGSPVPYRLADDFTVPPGQMWYVESIEVYAYRTQAQSSPPINFTDGVIQVWDRNPMLGGANVVFGDTSTNRLTSSVYTNTNRVLETTSGTSDQRKIVAVTLSVGKTFKPGNYWVEYGMNTNAAPGSAYAPPITINGVDSTGDAVQLNTTTGTWAALSDTTPGGPVPIGMPFRVCGEVACCWDSDFGTNLNHGDDSFTAGIALPFTFRFGSFGSTTLIGVSSNGTIALDNVGLGTNFNCNLGAFTSASVLGLWDDFNPAAGGAVYANIHSQHAVFTWYKVESFQSPNTPDESTFQIQMFPDGDWTLAVCRHDVSWQPDVVAGISTLGPLQSPLPIDLSSGRAWTPFADPVEDFSPLAGGSDLAGLLLYFGTNPLAGIGGYSVTPAPACCAIASAVPYGAGCDAVTCVPNGLPIMGQSMNLHTAFNGVPRPGVMLVGVQQRQIPLLALGLNAPGCDLLHDNGLPFVGMDGNGDTPLGIPCLAALLGGTLRFQGIVFAGANPFGLSLSNGVALTIGAID